MRWRERPTALVAKREMREAVRAKSFWITLALTAAGLLAIIVISNLSNGEEPVTVAVAGDVSESAIATLDGVGASFNVVEATDDDAAAAAVRDGDVDLAVLDDGSRLLTEEPVDLTDGSDLATVANVLRAELALERGLRAAGLDDAAAATVRGTEPPPIEALTAGDGEIDSGRAGVVTVTNILLFIMLQTYGQWVVTGVTREKSSRIVEVLLAVVRPRQLLVGKVIGIGLVALAHAFTIIVTAVVATRAVGADVLNGLRVGDLAVSAVWFLLGYALYCGAFAAAGSLCSRVEDAQGVVFPVVLPLLLSYFASFSAIGGANTLLWVLAFIPPTAVLAMPALYAAGAAPAWAVAVSMALTVAAIVVVATIASRIYERSVLRTGRKLRWVEALRGRSELGVDQHAVATVT